MKKQALNKQAVPILQIHDLTATILNFMMKNINNNMVCTHFITHNFQTATSHQTTNWTAGLEHSQQVQKKDG